MQLSRSFEESLQRDASDAELADALGFVRNQLQNHEPLREARHSPDVEMLLTAVRELICRAEHPLAAYVEQWNARVPSVDILEALARRIEDFIREECVVDRTKVDYLSALRSFIDPIEGLDVVTLNYDYAVEMICQELDVPYTDGFATYWAPAQFEADARAVRLHKLHGSLLWYETARPPRRLVKIPVVPVAGQTHRFFSDDDVLTTLIYPTLTKAQHAEPYATLLDRFRRALRSIDTLIVIGYSFRDRYIKELVLQKMHENPDLRLIVIDPRPVDVLLQSDNTVAGAWTFATFRHRVFTIADTAAQAVQDDRLARYIRQLRVLRQKIVEANAMKLDVEEEEAVRSAADVYRSAETIYAAPLIADRLCAGDGIWDEAYWRGAGALGSVEDFIRHAIADGVGVPASREWRDQGSAVFRLLVAGAAGYLDEAMQRLFLLNMPPDEASRIGRDDRGARDSTSVTSWFRARGGRAASAAHSLKSWATQLRWVAPKSRSAILLSDLAADMQLVADYFQSGVEQRYMQQFDGFTAPVASRIDLKQEIGKRFAPDGTPRSLLK